MEERPDPDHHSAGALAPEAAVSSTIRSTHTLPACPRDGKHRTHIASPSLSQPLPTLGSPAPHHWKMFMSAMEMMHTVSGPSALSSDSFLCGGCENGGSASWASNGLRGG